MTSDQLIESPLQVPKASALTFGALFAGESLLRSMNVSVIPLQAYDLLGSSQKVSMVSTAVSFAVLLTTLLLPYIFRNARRRWIYSFGIAVMVASACFFASYTVAGQVVGLYLRNAGAAVLSITLSLYIMDNIRRTELTKSEPLRLATSTLSWVIGPALGAWLYATHGPIVAQLAVVGAAAALAAGFWYTRLYDPGTLPSGTLTSFSPLANAVAFFAKPRLRLAWSIAFGRSCFWSVTFIYGPLLMVEGGLAKTTAGLLLSLTQFALPVGLLYGKAARRWGVRPIITFSFVGMTMTALLAGLFGKSAVLSAAICLLIGAFCATGLDGVGGIPFLRAVKPSQRQQMTSVYRTFIECAELLPGFVFAILLLYFEIGVVFLALSVLMAYMAWVSWRYLPKSM